MATDNTKGQQTLPSIPPIIENGTSKTDRAITAVRDYMAGKATTAFVRDCLAQLEPKSFLWVSLATRVPEARLKAMATLDTSA